MVLTDYTPLIQLSIHQLIGYAFDGFTIYVVFVCVNTDYA